VVLDGKSADVNFTKVQLQALLNQFAPSSPLNDPVHTVFCLQGAANSGTASREAVLFIPLLAGQGLLFIMTLLRFRTLTNKQTDPRPLTGRLVRDGIIFFGIFFVGLGLDVANASADLPKLELPFFYANFTGVVQSIIISHLILSIRSLAARLTNDPGNFLLNESEMRRLYHLHGVRPQSGIGSPEIMINIDIDNGARSRNSVASVEAIPTNLTLTKWSSKGLPAISRVGVFEPTFARADTPASRYALESMVVDDDSSFIHMV